MNTRVAIAVAVCLLAAGCQQKMARQPAYKPLEPSAFFPDGRSARPLVAGTVANNSPLPDARLLTGRTAAGNPAAIANPGANPAARDAALVGLAAQGGLAPLPGAATNAPVTREAALAEYVDTFPIPIDRAALERGRQRFNIFCAVCHDETGHGHGKIVERGYTMPPSYVPEPGIDGSGDSRGFQRRGFKVLLRDVPIGYFYEVITLGYGAMPDYAGQVAPEDRWKIAAYIRALQLSQYADLNSPALRPDREAIENDLSKEAP
jgi:mono/diheme cytochrome c family protein